jgi:hypothetical protein
MALNLEGWVTPENQFEGLYRAGNVLERNNQREQHKQEQAAQRKTTNAKFLTDYLDPKENLSGSPYDPQIVGGFNGLLQEGMRLVNEGYDANAIMMALAPKAGKLSTYAQKAKLLNAQKKDLLAKVGKDASIDSDKFAQAFDEVAFYDVDAEGNRQLRDIDKIDTSLNYGDELLRNHPDKFMTNAGFDDFFKDQVTKNSITESDKVTRYRPTGGMSLDKVKTTRAGYFVKDTDEKGAFKGFVPKYEIATDDNQPILNKFIDPEGKEVDAPVRILSKDIFESLPPQALNYVKGEVKKLLTEHNKVTGENVALNSPQAEMLARAIAYDELNSPTRQGWKVENEDIITGGYYAPRSSGSGSGDGDANINDIYGEIYEAAKGKKNEGKPYLQTNLLSADAQNIVIDFARKVTGDNQLGQSDIKIVLGNDGNLGVYWADDGQLISFLTKKAINVKAQVDVKGKRKVVEQGDGKEKTETKTFVFPNGKTKF